MPDPQPLDLYAPLSHKLALDPASQRASSLSPTWVPAVERRRLAAYTVLAAYLDNCGRYHLRDGTDDTLREYGDADLLVDRVVAGVLGDGWAVTVDGADLDLNSIELPPKPDEPVAGADALETRLHALRLTQWQAEATATLEQLEADAEALPALQARQEAITAWADQAHLSARIDEGEHDAVGLGDGIYVLWPQVGAWPTVTCMAPDAYFPDLDDAEVTVFPDGITFAWEYEVEQTGAAGVTRTRMLRRITFELVEIVALRTDGVDWLDEAGNPVPTVQLGTDEQLLDGRVHRSYPWDPPDLPAGERSTRTCIMSDGTWDLSRTSISGLADLSDDAATWAVAADGRPVRNLDLRQDFIPVIHNPNTTNSKEHFGRSVLSSVAQILDDVARADTDTMQASRYLSDPTMALSGATATADTVVAPGKVFGLGADGRMDVLDLSAGLEKLMAHRDALADRYWVNGRVPKEVIGRVDASEVPSGVALALSFAPFAQLVGTLRMARDPKYRLLLKFAQRMAQVQGVLPPGPTPVARISWGNFLPTNRTETAKIVNEALAAHAISTATAVRMLVAGGFPIDDATAEVERIREEDARRAAAAKDLADATGSEAAAAAWYGIELPTGQPQAGLPPVIDLPE